MSADANVNEENELAMASTPAKTNGTVSNNNLQVEGDDDGGSSIGGIGKPTSGAKRDADSDLFNANRRPGKWGQRGSGDINSPASGDPGSRGGSPQMDNYSDLSHGAGRPKSRNQDATGSLPGGGMPYPSSRYNVSSFWKARRCLFYRNGDPFFPAIEFRFKPGRDISTLDKLLDKISARMDLPRGARYIFSVDGDRKFSLDEIEDGGSYVVSSFKVFKV